MASESRGLFHNIENKTRMSDIGIKVWVAVIFMASAV